MTRSLGISACVGLLFYFTVPVVRALGPDEQELKLLEYYRIVAEDTKARA